MKLKIRIKNHNDYENTLEYKFNEIKYNLKRKILILRNELRVKFVNSILGKDLLMKFQSTQQGDYVELIDEKRKVTYGKWIVKRIDEKKYKITR